MLLAVWMAINVPFLAAKPDLNDRPDPDDDHKSPVPREVEKEEAGRYAEEVREEFMKGIIKLTSKIVDTSKDYKEKDEDRKPSKIISPTDDILAAAKACLKKQVMQFRFVFKDNSILYFR